MVENRVENEVAAAHKDEVQRGERFEFGQNWREFLKTLDDERITIAESSLQKMLGKESLTGLSFLDIGSGSGLFSLAARRLGARVHSFDYDPESVACTEELRQRYFPEDDDWVVERASVLNRDTFTRWERLTSFIPGVCCTRQERCGKRLKSLALVLKRPGNYLFRFTMIRVARVIVGG